MRLALEKQYNYYAAHENELLKQFKGLYLVISNDMNVYSFENPKEAYVFGVKNFGAGNYMLHKCEPDTLDRVHTINCTSAL